MEGMELPLRDIHLPDSISWWPLAPGWWIVLGMVMLLILLIDIIDKKYFKPNLKRQALKALKNIEESFHVHDDATQCVSELSALLRRVVISQNLPIKMAGLTGQSWLELLDQQLGKSEFSQGVGQLLLTGPYQPQVEKKNVTQLIHLCRKWMNCL